MKVEVKKMKIEDVDSGKIVCIKDDVSTESKLRRLYLVLDETTVVKDDDIDYSIVYIADIYTGNVYKVKYGTLVTIVESKLVVDLDFEE